MEHGAHIVWIMGVLLALWAVTVEFKPDWMKKGITFIKQGKLVYLVAASKIILGIIFLIFARECKWPWVIIIIGILSIAGPILFCLLSLDNIKAYLAWWENRPAWLYRVWGILAAVFGGLIMYAGVPK